MFNKINFRIFYLSAVPLLVIILFFSHGFSGQKPQVETFVPDDVIVFVKSSPLEKLLKSVNFSIEYLLNENQKSDINEAIDEFKELTGIDPVNAASLSSAGIDVSRPVSAAYSGENIDGQEKLSIIIPVLNDKIFPEKFMDIIKENSGDEYRDVYPAIIDYKDKKIYQVERDVYFTSFKGWFFAAPARETIESIIDLESGDGQPVGLSQEYSEYNRRSRNDLDINAFIKREFFDDIFSIFSTFTAEPADGSESFFGMVDYFAFSAGIHQKNIVANAGVGFNEANPIVIMALNLLKTGTSVESIFIADSLSASFFSVDLEYLEKACRSDYLPGCMEYAMFKMQADSTLGIDLSKDFIPNFSGVINSFVTGIDSSTGEPEEFVLYLPMKDPGKTAAMIEKITSNLTRQGGVEIAGRTAIGDKKGFWISFNEERYEIVSDERGIYAGTSKDVVAEAVAGVAVPVEQSRFSVFQDNDIFAFNYLARELYEAGKEDIQKLFETSDEIIPSALGDFYFVGKKDGNTLSFDFIVEVTGTDR